MNKEILDDIKSTIEIFTQKIEEEKTGVIYIHKDYLKQLLDYITNLEQNEKEWSMIFDTFSKRPYAHKYIEEKKKELNNNKIIGLDSEMIYKDYYDLKLRIDKAIEYLEQPNRDNFDYSKVQLIQILEGK